MTFENARSFYRKAEASMPVDPVDPHEIIAVTLRELEKSLSILAAAQKSENPFPPIHVKRSFIAIYILQSNLDFEKGGEIATNLFRVYEFCRIQVADVFARKPNVKLEDAASYIEGIQTAWEQIGRKAEV